MNKLRIFLKNFTAGRKALFKRMGILLGSALAVFEVVQVLLQDDSIAQLCGNIGIFGISLKSILTNVFVYLAIGAVVALIRQGSFAHYCMNIAGTDVKIEISMADIFSNKGEIVVPCNTTFSVNKRIVGDKSIQSQMTARLKLPKDNPLDKDEYCERQVKSALASCRQCMERRLPEQRVLIEAADEFSYGTMLPLNLPIDGKPRNVILLAVAKMVEPHKPKTDGAHLMASIDDMWNQIAENRTREQTLIVPIMGTGSAGLTDKPQQTVARYILRTFADNAHRLGIKKLILSVYPQDYLENKVNLEELRSYADYICRFPDSDFDIK